MKYMFSHQQGQALISLLYFVLIGTIVISAAVVLMATNSTATTKIQEGTLAYTVAESGAEEGLMQILRNPTGYVGTNIETLQVGGGTATISATGGPYPSPMTITAVGTEGNYTRKIEVDVTFVSGALTIQAWKEIY